MILSKFQKFEKLYEKVKKHKKKYFNNMHLVKYTNKKIWLESMHSKIILY